VGFRYQAFVFLPPGVYLGSRATAKNYFFLTITFFR
jgi:hypothetical protein